MEIATLLLQMVVSEAEKEYEASTEVQKKIVNAAYITPSPGAGWCAMWVSQVYQNAGLDIPEEMPVICTETTPLHQINQNSR